MIRTRVGYSGGTKNSPTYYDLGDHSETIEIDFDPSLVSYEDLLGVFFDSHNAARPAYSRQYRSAIFYHSDAQRETAERVLKARHQAAGLRLSTAIEPFSGFTRAEDYHQKYYLTHDRRLMAELLARYPEVEAFTDSTVVARLNGLAGGYKLPAADFGSPPDAQSADIRAYGLTEATSRYLAELAASARQVVTCGGGQATPRAGQDTGRD